MGGAEEKESKFILLMSISVHAGTGLTKTRTKALYSSHPFSVMSA